MKAVNVNNVLKIMYKYGRFLFTTDGPKYTDMMDEIANLPGVTTDVDETLGKIKSEIQETYSNCDMCEWFEDYDYEENDISEYRPVGDIEDILQIIDKYNTENGGK